MSLIETIREKNGLAVADVRAQISAIAPQGKHIARAASKRLDIVSCAVQHDRQALAAREASTS